jgi:hypothetical protein
MAVDLLRYVEDLNEASFRIRIKFNDRVEFVKRVLVVAVLRHAPAAVAAHHKNPLYIQLSDK